jgi:hypothetical protein
MSIGPVIGIVLNVSKARMATFVMCFLGVPLIAGRVEAPIENESSKKPGVAGSIRLLVLFNPRIPREY